LLSRHDELDPRSGGKAEPGAGNCERDLRTDIVRDPEFRVLAASCAFSETFNLDVGLNRTAAVSMTGMVLRRETRRARDNL
jgi:hypothetical protein